MINSMIIDAHTHIYPEKIAEKAVKGISEFYDIEMSCDGTLKTLFKLGDAAGVNKYLVHSVATTPRQTRHLCDFIAEQVRQFPDKLIGFGSVHPDGEDVAADVEYILSLGLKGIKLHPDFQKFNIDSPEAMKIYEAAEGRLPILFHTGDYRTQYSRPQRLLNVKKAFPKLDVIGAHFGNWSQWEEGLDILGGADIYVDTSSSQYALTPEKVRALIDGFGTDRILFGSDYPMWNPKDEIEMLDKVLRSDEEREMIYHGNLERLLAKYE